jgi:hypothetical protein
LSLLNGIRHKHNIRGIDYIADLEELVNYLESQNNDLKSLCLWSARRLSHQQYKDYAYGEYEEITEEKPERL